MDGLTATITTSQMSKLSANTAPKAASVSHTRAPSRRPIRLSALPLTDAVGGRE